MLCICRIRTTNVKKVLSVDQKVTYGHKNPNDSHTFHDESHDEIELYPENSDKST